MNQKFDSKGLLISGVAIFNQQLDTEMFYQNLSKFQDILFKYSRSLICDLIIALILFLKAGEVSISNQPTKFAQNF